MSAADDKRSRPSAVSNANATGTVVAPTPNAARLMDVKATFGGLDASFSAQHMTYVYNQFPFAEIIMLLLYKT